MNIIVPAHMLTSQYRISLSFTVFIKLVFRCHRMLPIFCGWILLYYFDIVSVVLQSFEMELRSFEFVMDSAEYLIISMVDAVSRVQSWSNCIGCGTYRIAGTWRTLMPNGWQSVMRIPLTAWTSHRWFARETCPICLSLECPVHIHVLLHLLLIHGISSHRSCCCGMRVRYWGEFPAFHWIWVLVLFHWSRGVLGIFESLVYCFFKVFSVKHQTLSCNWFDRFDGFALAVLEMILPLGWLLPRLRHALVGALLRCQIIWWHDLPAGLGEMLLCKNLPRRIHVSKTPTLRCRISFDSFWSLKDFSWNLGWNGFHFISLRLSLSIRPDLNILCLNVFIKICGVHLLDIKQFRVVASTAILRQASCRNAWRWSRVGGKTISRSWSDGIRLLSGELKLHLDDRFLGVFYCLLGFQNLILNFDNRFGLNLFVDARFKVIIARIVLKSWQIIIREIFIDFQVLQFVSLRL